MKTQKRLLAGLLSVAICLSLLLTLPIAAGAADWKNWPEGSVDTPYIQKLTIDGKDITAYKKMEVIQAISSSMERRQGFRSRQLWLRCQASKSALPQ